MVARGRRIAWAESRGTRQRVVVRDMATGRERVAADMPSCVAGRCYRIDAVTLADHGVVFDRGAVGPQPSSVVRRELTAPRPESVRIAHDPQPDLVPSSAGALYYAFGRGWRRWDFGRRHPRPVSFGSGLRPVAFDAGTWLLERPAGCGEVLLARRAGRTKVVGDPESVRRLAGAGRDLCATVVSITGRARAPVVTWALAPAASHSAAGATGVIALGSTRAP
jgi:hypothetical protein